MIRGYVAGFGESGIRVLDVDDGHMTVRPGAAVADSSYLALSEDRRLLYAVLEDADAGQVAAFAVERDELRPFGNQPTGGSSPCHLSVHPSGRFVLSANYGSGSISVHPIDDDGSLGERTDLVQHHGGGPVRGRQDGPHAHMVAADPSGAHVLAVDLGTDAVYRYRLDVDAGRLFADGVTSLPPGTGPRHLAFHPDGRHAFVVGELDSAVHVLDLATMDPGAAVATLPGDANQSNHPSAIRISDDGRFCYVANRGHDSIAVLAVVDGPSLRLTTTVPCGGEHPRDLVLADDWLFVANQFSSRVTVFRVNAGTGTPAPHGSPVATPSPSCIVLR